MRVRVGHNLPVGYVLGWLGDVPPDGWLECTGEPFASEDYPSLAEALGKASTPCPRETLDHPQVNPDIRMLIIKAFPTPSPD